MFARRKSHLVRIVDARSSCATSNTRSARRLLTHPCSMAMCLLEFIDGIYLKNWWRGAMVMHKNSTLGSTTFKEESSPLEVDGGGCLYCLKEIPLRRF